MDTSMLAKAPFNLTEDERSWVEEAFSAASIDEKIAQLFLVLGVDPTLPMVRDLARDLSIGGVLIRPCPTAKIKAEHDELDELAKIPLLKAANLEEGGAGVITDGTYFGTQMLVGAAHDSSIAEAFAKNCALEGRLAGVNWAFAPVLDPDWDFRNPITNVRTFGADVESIIEYGKIYVETVQRYGIAACAKHYPGDGLDYRDQHLHPTYNPLSVDEWRESYGRIYQEMIDAGVLSFMAAHIIAPEVIKAMDPEAGPEEMLPASQSKAMLTDMLRGELGFNGLIITDATVMGGFTQTMPRATALPLAIEAGCDMFCFCANEHEDMAFVKAGFESGLLSEARLDEAVLRVLGLKAVLSREYPLPELDSEAERVRCADEAITLVKDTQNLLPVTKERFPQIKLVRLGEDETFDGSLTEMVLDHLTKRGFAVDLYNPDLDFMHGPGDTTSADCLTLIVAYMPTFSHQTTVRLQWSRNLALDLPRYINEEKTAFISFANPYHLQDVPRVKTYINAYAASKATVDATLDKLIGLSPFKGESPVDAFCGLEDTKL